MAKARKGSRAKGKKSTGKPKKKKVVLNLKQLRRDILRAKKFLTKRHEKAAAKAAKAAVPMPAPEPPTSVYEVFDRWTGDIDAMCSGPGGQPCGPDMVIS